MSFIAFIVFKMKSLLWEFVLTLSAYKSSSYKTSFISIWDLGASINLDSLDEQFYMVFFSFSSFLLIVFFYIGQRNFSCLSNGMGVSR